MNKTVNAIAALCVIVTLGLAGCGGAKQDLDAAKQEMVSACVDERGTTPAYCRCAADFVFERFSSDVREFVARVAALPPDLDDAELARRLGTTESDLRHQAAQLNSQWERHMQAAARNCASSL